MNIAFLTSGHFPHDDRIYYHMARSLSDFGYVVEIVSSKVELTEFNEGIKINSFEGNYVTKREKISRFIAKLQNFTPDVIVCSEPLTILASRAYSKSSEKPPKIIYDITEWYPSKKNLASLSFPVKWIVFIKLLVFNLWATCFVDAFIFGEWYKSRPYRILFHHKPYIFVSYFPDLRYINTCSPKISDERLRLSYSGKISFEKGYGNFFKLLNYLSVIKPDLKIEVTVIGWYEDHRDKEKYEALFVIDNPNITLNLLDRQDYLSFIESIKYTDIFLDLRDADFENNRCLPIKLFYYAALGRPVIFSDLRSIRKETEAEKFGYLVNPKDYQSIARIISGYLENHELYYRHCENARYLSETYYNWKITEPGFLKFITSI